MSGGMRVTGLPAMAALAAAISLSACESTQDKSKRLGKEGSKVFQHTTHNVVAGVNREVRVLGTTVLHDQNGSAAVVELRNGSPKGLVNVPIAIDVKGINGASVFKNNAAGIEPSLQGVSMLKPRAEFAWVNDQVTAAGAPKSVQAQVGVANAGPAKVPQIDVTPPKLGVDPTSGVDATGTVTNKSNILQIKLVLYCVARQGGRVVAAGRGGVDRLKPGAKVKYTIFFIGDPHGAKLSLLAPPTTFQ
jgi:hypothetical protein